MRLTFLGTCAGTEPMPGRLHTSVLLEIGEHLYFLDAGEACSRTAYLLGHDLTRVRGIFLSHAHMDHTGGLPNLLWTIRKLHGLSSFDGRVSEPITVYTANLPAWNAVTDLLSHTEGNFGIDFELNGQRLQPGLCLDTETLCVTAEANTHLPVDPDQGPQSFSFRIESAGASLVYSGDVGTVRDLEPLLQDPADLVLVETGHHSVEDICSWAEANRENIGRLGFYHHGRAILRDPATQLRVARAHTSIPVFFANDADTVDL
ncbi:MAG: MBL fold metallo-hydrolase [Spirochaetaceae bacterium]|nr:MAG: MBL fold metallo-hydrolase [Spirochaetaceae bacterium]